MFRTHLEPKNQQEEAKETKPFQVKTFLYYVIAISVTTVTLAQVTSWATAYFKVKKEMTEESETLLAEREERRLADNGKRNRTKLREESVNQAPIPEASAASESSLRSYRSALQMDPGSISARQRLAAALLARNQAKEAIEVLREGLKQAPYSGDIRSMLAEALERDGQNEAALQEYQRLVFDHPSRAEYVLSVARVMESLGRNGEALNWYERAASQNKAFESDYQQASRRLSDGK